MPLMTVPTRNPPAPMEPKWEPNRATRAQPSRITTVSPSTRSSSSSLYPLLKFDGDSELTLPPLHHRYRSPTPSNASTSPSPAPMSVDEDADSDSSSPSRRSTPTPPSTVLPPLYTLRNDREPNRLASQVGRIALETRAKMTSPVAEQRRAHAEFLRDMLRNAGDCLHRERWAHSGCL